MINDLNNEEYLKALGDAGNSKDGLVIAEFLQSELVKISYDNISDNLDITQTGIEYLSIRKTRQYLKKVLNYLIGV